VARKKKIPSVDEALQIMLERVKDDLNAEIRRLRDQGTSLSRKVAGLERKLSRLQSELGELQQLRPTGQPVRPRKRVSPDKAQEHILSRLKKNQGRYLTSKELGSPLGIGRATVAARVKELREQGHEIASSPRKGYAIL
jgi:biotin operon repressor